MGIRSSGAYLGGRSGIYPVGVGGLVNGTLNNFSGTYWVAH